MSKTQNRAYEYTQLIRGKLGWTYLDKPDVDEDDYPLGIYKTPIVPSPEDAQEHLEALQEIWRQHFGTEMPTEKSGVWRFAKEPTGERDAEGKRVYEATDKIEFNVQAKNRENRKTGELWDRRPNVWDGEGNPVTNLAGIGKGSEVLIKLELFCGSHRKKPEYMQLVPTDILVLNAVDPRSGGDKTNPFGKEELEQSSFTASDSPFGKEDFSEGSDKEDDASDY